MSEQIEIEALRAEVDELRASLQRLEQGSRPETQPVDDAHPSAPVDRRQWMKTAAGVAVGGAAAIVAAPAGRAAAANGDELRIGNLAGAGSPQSATAVTQLNFTATEDNGFVVQSGSAFSGESSSFNAAMSGWTSRNANPVGVYGFSSSSVTSGSIGVLGRGDGAGGAGVRGEGRSSVSDGVVGRAFGSSRSGVRGEGPVAMRAIGTTTGLVADGSAGGQGVSASGLDGVVTNALRYGVTARGAVAQLLLPPTGTTAAPDLADTHAPGEVRVNQTTGATTAEMWVCVEAGDPGVWRRVAGPATAGSFVAIAPGRAYDSRQPQPEQGKLVNPASRTVSVRERRDTSGTIIPGGLVPVGATAISYNLTLVNTVGGGFVGVEPGTSTEAVSSAINWTQSGQTIANAGIVQLAADGTIRLFAEGTGGSTDVIIDVTGYWL